MPTATDRPPLVAHVIFRLDVGGLENGLVNLINRIPADRFRHAVICLTDYSDFGARIRNGDTAVLALNKPEGNSPAIYFKLWRALRQLRPAIVHTRNLAALEAQLPAFLAGVPARIHSEHGRDMVDLHGDNARHLLVRRLHRPLVHRYIALSQDLERYLRDKVGVAAQRIEQIYNGVDTEVFRPAPSGRETLGVPGFDEPGLFLVGTVGRMQKIKDQLTLARAFLRLREIVPDAGKLRLVMAGEGPLRAQAQSLLDEAGAAWQTWLPGSRDDVPRIMRSLDLFVLPSLSEGISNTILEAMASGLPVVATNVGGNPELVQEGVSGSLVPADDPAAMAEALRFYFENRAECRKRGEAARRIAERHFSLAAMVDGYMRVYDEMLEARRGHPG